MCIQYRQICIYPVYNSCASLRAIHTNTSLEEGLGLDRSWFPRITSRVCVNCDMSVPPCCDLVYCVEIEADPATGHSGEAHLTTTF